MIPKSLFIDKIHKNNNSFLIISNAFKSLFCIHYCMFLRASVRKDVKDSCLLNLSKCKPLLLQPIKLLEKNINEPWHVISNNVAF